MLPVQIRGILPANSGAAIFLGNDEKVFVIQVESNMASVIGMFLNDAPKERPLTHDLMSHLLRNRDGHDQQVGLAGRGSEYLSPKAGNVVAGSSRTDHLLTLIHI
mgnify:CR=1 FL=1